MASDVLICNAALQLIKHSKTITSLEQGTKEANACEVIYTEVRDAVLSMHNWNFATKRVKMAQIASGDDRAPVFEWDYGYEFPGDFLRLVSVHDNSAGYGGVQYKIEANQVNSDATALWIRYIFRETDPNKMIPLFRVALSTYLASRLSVALAQNTSRSKELHEQFIDQDLPMAKSADSIQDMAEELPESSWVSVRSGQAGLDNELKLSTD